jgi:hypothetical protein
MRTKLAQWELPWQPAHLAVASSEQSITFQVKKNALEQMPYSG